MTTTNKLLIVILVFLAKVEVLRAQTYITPIVGYEWNAGSAQPNRWNVGNHLEILNPLPFRSFNLGVLSKRKISPNSFLSSGVIYSKYKFDIYFGLWSSLDIFHKMEFSRIRALLGYEFILIENLILSSNLSVNHIFDSEIFPKPNGQVAPVRYPKNRIHLGIIMALNFKVDNIVLRPYLEWGIWNLKGHMDLAASRPISGFGLSLGYQFSL